jgi:hypothetical protein
MAIVYVQHDFSRNLRRMLAIFCIRVSQEPTSSSLTSCKTLVYRNVEAVHARAQTVAKLGATTLKASISSSNSRTC